jgi:hypothetical protein
MMTRTASRRTRTTHSWYATSAAPSSESLVAGTSAGGTWGNSTETIDGAHPGSGMGPDTDDVLVPGFGGNSGRELLGSGSGGDWFGGGSGGGNGGGFTPVVRMVNWRCCNFGFVGCGVRFRVAPAPRSARWTPRDNTPLIALHPCIPTFHPYPRRRVLILLPSRSRFESHFAGSFSLCEKASAPKNGKTSFRTVAACRLDAVVGPPPEIVLTSDRTSHRAIF